MYKEKSLKIYSAYILLMLPFVLIYMVIFTLSMHTALDRLDYLRVMDVNYAGNRIEPLLPFISNVLDSIVSLPIIKLFLLQFSFFFLFIQILYLYFKPISAQIFAKSLLTLLLFIAVFSNPLGVQLRIGYASLIFLYLITRINHLRVLPHAPLFALPIFMHYGTSFGVLFYWYVNIFKINTTKRFILHSLIVIISLTVLVTNIDQVFSYLGLSRYYYGYLEENSDLGNGRAIPFTALFYILLCIYNVILGDKKDLLLWFTLTGLWLIYLGFFLKFYLAFKMLLPILMYTLLYTIRSFPLEKKPYIYVTSAYILMPIVFYYFSTQVDLI